MLFLAPFVCLMQLRSMLPVACLLFVIVCCVRCVRRVLCAACWLLCVGSLCVVRCSLFVVRCSMVSAGCVLSVVCCLGCEMCG